MTAPPEHSGPMKLVYGKLEFDIRRQTLKIGRNKTNDIQIADQLVSGSHAMIRDGKIFDKGSTNGTFVNTTQIPNNTYWPLHPGDEISVGDTKLRVEGGAPYANVDIPARDALQDSSQSDSDSDSDDDVPGMETRRGGPDWLSNAPLAGSSSNGKLTGIAGKRSAGDGKDDPEHTLWVLQKKVESLMTENRKLKASINPQRQRLMKRREKEAQQKLMMKIRNLQHQVFYGQEKEEDLVKELSEENKTLKDDLEKYRQAHVDLGHNKMLLEETREQLKVAQDNADMFKKRCDILMDKTRELVKDNQLLEERHLQEIKRLAATGGGGGADMLREEMRVVRQNTQKIYVAVVLFAVIIILGFLFTVVRPPSRQF